MLNTYIIGLCYWGDTMDKKDVVLGTKNITGANVEIIRKQRGLKQKDLVNALAEKGIVISASGLSKLEKRNRRVTDIEVLALAEILEVSVEELLDSNDD